ncbi:hypothetical protein BGZ98_005984 [Dissophora globulifera]|nr:hypothetical protein BGZ98_005984 [Dissophora globulifera]
MRQLQSLPTYLHQHQRQQRYRPRPAPRHGWLPLLALTLLLAQDLELSGARCSFGVSAQLLSVQGLVPDAVPVSVIPARFLSQDKEDGFVVQDPVPSYYDSDSNDSNKARDEDEEQIRQLLQGECQRLMEIPSGAASLPLEPAFMTGAADDISETSNGATRAPGIPAWRLWYRTPAKSVEHDGFLLGNGRAQVLVGGSINVERLVLNEESCWSGGPGSARMAKAKATDDVVNGDYEYRGGNVATEDAQERQEALLKFRDALREKQKIFPTTPIAKTLQGDERGFGRPEAFGEILVEEMRPFERVDHYKRELDLETGIARVSFSKLDVEYTREHFCSYPDSVCMMRIKSSQPKAISIKVLLNSHHSDGLEYTNIHNRLGMRARLASNNMTIEAMVAIKTEGATGVSMSNNRQVIALGFDAITLYYTVGTGWAASAFPDFEDKDPHDRLATAVDKALTLFYPDQVEKHVKDYQALFQGFSLDLGQPENIMTTNELIEASRNGRAGSEESYLDAVMVQYARYLLISLSRPGSLPISGHTVWGTDKKIAEDSPSSGYKMNIDLQMNYWLAESTGLGETVGPLIDYMENLLVPRGQDTAQLHHGVRGWMTHPFSNIWAHTGPTSELHSFYFPAASAWLCQQVWDHYLYSQDYYYLRDHAYPLMKGASQFWVESLVQHQGGGNNISSFSYLTSPSYSPEHGPFTEGSALDQQLVWQLFNATLEAVAVVGEKDKTFVQNLTGTLAGLSPGLKVGGWGQLQEWNLDLDDPNSKFRHLAPFWAVYPGHQIFLPRGASTPNGNCTYSRDELLQAARVSLERRGMGDTEEEKDLGWPKSWRAAVWARLSDGAKASEALDLFKARNVKHANLLDFEEGLAGQLGIGAAIVEMVIQSRAPGFVDILTAAAEPGLPERWLKKGGVQGYRTREGHQVTAAWEEGKVRRVEVLASVKAAVLAVRIGTMKDEEETPSSKVRVAIKGSTKVPVFKRERDAILLTMTKGLTYVIEIDV